MHRVPTGPPPAQRFENPLKKRGATIAVRNVVRRGYSQDSVALMQLSTRLAALEGVRQASAVMATEANQALLAEAGLLTDEARGAAANDLLLALDAVSEEALSSAVGAAERLLRERVE